LHTLIQRKWLALGTLAAAWLICAVFLASTGAFSIDETIYSIMIERFATAGALTIPNGYAEYPSEALLVKFLVPGPHGLVPQYPSGYAILAAPFFLAGGLQGVVVLNAVATILTLVVLYRLVETLFDDRDLALNAALILGFTCFITEYALGIWPHAVSVLFVTIAAYCVALCRKAEHRPDWAFAALSGLVVALGATIRVDSILAAPIFLAWLFCNTRRPVIQTSAYVLGTAVGLVLSAWMNHLKFGTWMPISYGRDLGATTPAAYLPLLPLAIAAVAGMIAFAAPKVRRFLLGRRGVLSSAGVLVLLLALPWTQELMLRVLKGLHILVIDFQAQPNLERFPGAYQPDGGPILMHGLLKKALAQSLPFLGFAILPLAGLFRPERRAALALCWLFPAVWFIPFAYLSWFGGMASNMRYFLPTLPFLSILAALAWREIRAQAPASKSWGIAGAVAVLATGWITYRVWPANSEAIVFASHLAIPDVLFLAAAVTALFWTLAPGMRPYLCRTSIMLFLSGTIWAGYTSLVFDPAVAQIRRHVNEADTQTYSQIEPDALVIAAVPEKFLFQLQRKTATLAVYAGRRIPVDIALIDRTLAQGRPVYIDQPEIAEAITAASPDGKYDVVPITNDPARLYAIRSSGG